MFILKRYKGNNIVTMKANEMCMREFVIGSHMLVPIMLQHFSHMVVTELVLFREISGTG